MIPLFKVAMSDSAGKAVQKVLSSGFIGQGKEVDAFEKEFSKYVPEGKDVVLTNSCTSAIHMVLSYLGVGPGDEVITTPLTCIATNAPILAVGARPVWADVDPMTGNIDTYDVQEKITARTKAIIVVDWTGRAPVLEDLYGLGVPVIRDVAHGPFVQEKEDPSSFLCYSFGPIKHLTCGDGGAIAAYPEIAPSLRTFRWYGLDRTSTDDFRCAQNIQHPGLKWNMNDINAAIGRANLQYARRNVEEHKNNAAALYSMIHNNLHVTKPKFDPESNYWVFPLLLNNRDERDQFKEYMTACGIMASQVHARNDDHLAYNFPNGPLPGLDEFDARQINIPCGWWLSEADLVHIAKCVNEFKPV